MEQTTSRTTAKATTLTLFKSAIGGRARSAASPQLGTVPILGKDASAHKPSCLTSADWSAIYRAAFERYLRTGALIEIGDVLPEYELKANKLRRAIFADMPRAGDHDGDADDSQGAVYSGLTAAHVGGGVVLDSTQVTSEQLQQIMPHAGNLADTYVEALNAAMATHGIQSPPQIAAFLAQVSVESSDLRNVVENLNYSARRLTEVWPTRFPSIQAAGPFAHNPPALGNHVYANRLGNGDEASGDGYLFRGRGLIQITGRNNYQSAGFAADPDALLQPNNAANSAASFWQDRGLNNSTNSVLGRNDFNAVSRTVNGGSIGSEERWQAYQRALSALQQ